MLPTPEEWNQITRFARELVTIPDPDTQRERLLALSLNKPRLADRLAAIVGLSLAL